MLAVQTRGLPHQGSYGYGVSRGLAPRLPTYTRLPKSEREESIRRPNSSKIIMTLSYLSI